VTEPLQHLQAATPHLGRVAITTAPQPPAQGTDLRIAFYNRLTTEDEQDPEQASRCRALIESIIAKHLDTDAAIYLDDDGGESPYCRTTNRPEPTREKPDP
jgi:hypothetical protein